MKALTTAIFVGCMMLLAGCAVRQGHFTVLTNQLINTRNFDLSNPVQSRHVVGKDTAQIIVLFPTGTPTLGGAISNGLQNSGGDVFTNADVSTFSWYIPYIYGQVGWEVSGDSVKTRKDR
ncbi:MAG: hypothetical protein L0H29_01770 [Sinobacteraceae bacterium]|nr:hypothetical protein [Nevskiaceae bacterium]